MDESRRGQISQSTKSISFYKKNKLPSLSLVQDEILFNIRLEEAPLFEDSSYTNSRTYFWGLQSLRTLNRAISSLISAWEYYENPGILDFLPLTEEERRTTSNEAFPDHIKRSMNYLSDIKRQMELLKSMIESNNAKQDEILALRDGVSLFLILSKTCFSVIERSQVS